MSWILFAAEEVKQAATRQTSRAYLQLAFLYGLYMDKLVYERLLLNQEKTPGFLASGGEEFNLGLEMRLDGSELLCNKA